MLPRIKALFLNLTIYGVGDVATQVVSFLLLPLFVRYLTTEDYGILSLLLVVEVVAKIIFRWGVDASFMRMYYDCRDTPARQRLASTIFFFLLAVNGTVLATALAAAPWIAPRLLGVGGHTLTLQLVFLNTFATGFYFLPFHVLRIEERSREFAALTFARSTATILGRLVLVIAMRQGVFGVVLADIIVSIVFTVALSRRFAPLLRPVFSGAVLHEALRFGLPRVPHGVAHQALAVSDRYLLSLFATLHDLGVYTVGVSLGLALKLFMSAFEYAWAPFYFGMMNEPDAPRIFARVTTYGVCILTLLAAGLSALAGDVVRLMTTPAFFAAAAVVPWIAVAASLQGIYLLTSIGLNITKHTEYYPVATGVAAAVGVGANLLLIPRFGIVGAALSSVVAYATLAGVAMRLSQRFYPIRYEWARLARVLLAGAASYAAAILLVPAAMTPIAGGLLRGMLVLTAFAFVLWTSGFFVAGEAAHLLRLVSARSAKLARR